MKYKNNQFFFENLKAINIVKKFGTPVYCYSYNKLKENITYFKKQFQSFKPLVCFSLKSNSSLSLLREIKKLGLGADVVSIGELMLALKAGINAKKIVFSGVGKKEEELNYALEKKILLINVESESEINHIEKIAKFKNLIVNVGIRLNPNIDAKTLKKISTGKRENKFGVEEKVFYKIVDFCKKSKNINLKCLSVHIGSQILTHKPYQKMLNILDNIINKTNYKFDFIDLGGGMGIQYDKKNKKLNYRKYNLLIKNFLKKHKSKIIFEPGRSIVGNIGVILTKIIYIKESRNKKFIILDAGMNDLMRPALYNAIHKILPSYKNKKKFKKTVEFVGPICETTDTFLTEKNFQILKENDVMIICNTGAYGMSLFSNYNMRPKPAELLIKGSKIKILNKRQKLTKLI
tara:strand:- start:2531 stop:3745 length:1215 start_codon:yes stop_codon:yes gene_type:complete